MKAKDKLFWRCRYCRRRNRVLRKEIQTAYDDTGRDGRPVLKLRCAHCGEDSLVEVVGLFESGGDVRLRSLRRDEVTVAGETISSSASGDPKGASTIAAQPAVDIWDDLYPENTLTLFQIYTEGIADRVSILSRCRGIASDFSDLTRYAVHWSADPKYRAYILEAFDSTAHIPREFLNWAPGLTKPLYAPRRAALKGITLSQYGLDFWHNLREVRTVHLVHVFASVEGDEIQVFMRVRGLTRRPDHDDVLTILWKPDLYDFKASDK